MLLKIALHRMCIWFVPLGSLTVTMETWALALSLPGGRGAHIFKIRPSLDECESKIKLTISLWTSPSSFSTCAPVLLLYRCPGGDRVAAIQQKLHGLTLMCKIWWNALLTRRNSSCYSSTTWINISTTMESFNEVPHTHGPPTQVFSLVAWLNYGHVRM